MMSSSSSCFCALSLKLLRAKRIIEVRSVAPAMPQPMGPARASRALPPAVPAPPAATAPPPSHASAACDAAAPDRVEIAVPVDAVPNVVAIHIAADGAMLATAAPAAIPPPALIADCRAASSSSFAYCSACVKAAFSARISSKVLPNSFGELAMLLIRTSTREREDRWSAHVPDAASRHCHSCQCRLGCIPRWRLHTRRASCFPLRCPRRLL